MNSSRMVSPPPAPDRRLSKRLAPPEVVIDQQIRRTRQQVKWVEIFQGLLVLAVVGLGVLFGAAVVDHWAVQGGLPDWVRWLVWAGLTGWTIVYFWAKVLPLIVYRIHPLYAAQAIETARPSLRNSLINFLLLRNDPRWAPEPVVRAIEESAAQELVYVEPESVVDRQPAIRLGYVLVGLAAVIAMYIILSPKNPLISFGRVLWPWADIPAPTRVRIEVVQPGDITAPRGEPVQVSSQVRGLAEEEEVLFYYSTADGQIQQQAIPMKPIEGELAWYRLPVDSFIARQDTQYYIQAGDARSRTYHIQVDIPLVMTAERLVYEYPSYTGLPKTEVRGQGDIRAVEGTKVRIEALANQKLSEADIDLDGQNRRRLSMRVEDRSAKAELVLRVAPADPLRPEYSSYLLRGQTLDGRSNRRPNRYMIEVLPDRPPRVNLRLGVLEEVPEEIELPRSRSVEMRVEAEDVDFGLRRVAIQLQKQGQLLDVPPLWQWQRPTLADPQPPSPPSTKGQPEGHQGPLQLTWEFVPAQWGLKPGDVVVYWARVEDTKLPKPNGAETPHRRIVIVEDTPGQPPQQQDRPPQAAPGQPTPPPGQAPEGLPKEPQPADLQAKPEQAKETSGQQGPAAKQPAGTQTDQQPGQPGSENPSQKPDSQPKASVSAKEPSAPGQPDQVMQTGTGKQPPEASRSEPADPLAKQPAGAEKPSESQPPADAKNPSEREKSESGSPSAKPESGSGQPKPDRGQQAPETGQPERTTGSAKPEPGSGSAKPPGGPEGRQEGQSRPEKSSSTAQGQPPAEPTSSPSPPQRVDPLANPGKAFDEILRDRAETQAASKPAGEKPPSEKPAAKQSGPEKPSPNLPGQESSAPSGHEKPEKLSSAQSTGQEKTAPGQKVPGGIESEPSSKPGADKPEPSAKPDSQLEGAEPSSKSGQEKQGTEKPSPSEAKPLPGQPKSVPLGPSAQEKISPEKGPPEPQETNQPRSSPAGQKPPGTESPQEPQSPLISKKQSDSRGEQSGDRSGGGQQGGGQQAHQPGAGTPGSQSPADQGAGLSDQPGQEGSQPGHQTPSPKPTGSAGQQPGTGPSMEKPASNQTPEQLPSGKPTGAEKTPAEGEKSSDREGPSGQIGTKLPKQVPEVPDRPGGAPDRPGMPSPKGSPEKPNARAGGNPETGGQPGQPTGPIMPNQPLQGDDPNLQYTRQAVDMALEYLRDRLREGDLRILETLRWSREDAESFLRRWEELKRQAAEAPPGSPKRQELDEMLKNLGLRPRGVSRVGEQTKPDDLRRLREGRSVPPPPDWAEQFRAFRRGIRAEQE